MSTLEPPKYPVVHQLTGNFDKIAVIGDVHGCYEELMELLEKLRGSIRYPLKLVYLGDLIDKGPFPKKVVTEAAFQCSIGLASCVQGNHDLNHVLHFLKTQKGEKTNKNEEFLKTHGQLDYADFVWMAGLPAAIQWENFLFTHAGVIEGLMFNQPLKAFIRNRYVVEKNGKYEFTGIWKDEDGKWQHHPDAVQWADIYQGSFKIFYGHEPRKDIYINGNTIGLDTSCAYGHKLTAAIIDCKTKEITFEQVKAKKVYYNL
jgi:serine/threonine protein phosphatase 1